MGIRTGILWMCAATCLFVWQDSTARILVQTYPVTEIAFVRYFIRMPWSDYSSPRAIRGF